MTEPTSTSLSYRNLLIFLGFALICIIISNPTKIFSVGRSFIDYISFSDCSIWSLDQYNQTSTEHLCPNEDRIKSTIWTYDSSGVKKYLQWIITRHFASVRFIYLSEQCQIRNDTHFHSMNKLYPLILVYFLPIQTVTSECSSKIRQIIETTSVQHIYFTRRSIKALQAFAQIDQSINISAHFREYTNFKQLIDVIPSNKWITVFAEDLVKDTLVDCENTLSDLIGKFGLHTSEANMTKILKFDSHHFVSDAIWWDQSSVVENILSQSIPTRPTTLNYASEVYYLSGRRSFAEYLLANRQCFNQGIFYQMPTSSIIYRNSTDVVDRCPLKPFDCAFSDLYSFEDREDMYHSSSFHTKPIKCGFAVPSMFDPIREKYQRNQTCETIIFTVITSCYDPLPEIKGTIHRSFCFVAIVDNRTMTALLNRNATGYWDVFDLGPNATVFSVEPKTTETIKLAGHRLFPLAKWIVWLDGKAKLIDLDVVLTRVPTPFNGAHHPQWERNLENEVPATIFHMQNRAGGLTSRFNNTLRDIKMQEAQYRLEGIYERSYKLGLRLYDIAVLMYRNQHPCMIRYMCSWHNEINYYSFRGQLSVYYPAVRLNLADYTDFLENKHFSTFNHRPIC